MSFDEFDSITLDELNEINTADILSTAIEENAKFKLCGECQVPMTNISEGLECPECHTIKKIFGRLANNTGNDPSVIRYTNGGGRPQYFTGGVADNSKVQRKNIIEQLQRLNEAYTGVKIPMNVLNGAADIFNQIQQTRVDVYDSEGKTIGSKKIVKRGQIKDELLGACVRYAAINAGVSRRDKEIANFMQINSSISDGIDFITDLCNRGFIELPVNIDKSHDFVESYLLQLKIINRDKVGDFDEASQRYIQFVIDIVDTAVKKHIGNSSIRSSKIVGAIWLLIVKCKFDITSQQVEDACDKTRTNTFKRFAEDVCSNIKYFIPVFEKHGIDPGVKYRRVAKKKK